MTKLTENESVLILDSMRKYRGIIKFTDTSKSTIQEIDDLVDKMISLLDENNNIVKEALGRNGYTCKNCE